MCVCVCVRERVCVCVFPRPTAFHVVFPPLQIREGGIRSLYKGFTPVFLRAFPANAVSPCSAFVPCPV